MIYTVYNPDTFEVLFSKEYETQPENSTTKVCIGNFVKAMYSPQLDSFYEGANEQELAVAAVNDEFLKYQQRKADGEAYHLRVCAELRVVKLGGGITQEQYDAVYAATALTRNEIVNGQWLSGLKELEKIQNLLSTGLYNKLHTYISNYIQTNY